MQVGAGLVQGRLRVKNEMRGQEFPVAQKIYGALLRAYPPAHRAEYGAAMAQLFRDQCRDAWGESKNFGLLKLWLRVLPDWAKTSLMERLAALNERKTMNEKLANLTSFQTPPRKIFTRVFVVVFLIIFITSVAVTLILPESYASRATIKIDGEGVTVNYDPYFLQTQFEIISSQSVLEPVIDKLHLREIWGKKYFNGERIKETEMLKILKGRLSIAPVRGTKLADITVYSEDRTEAAQIANAIAESYRDYRVNERVKLAAKEVNVLEQQYKNEGEQIQKSQAELEARRQESSTSPQLLKASEQELSQVLELHKLLHAKIHAAKLDVVIPHTTMVQITDPAEPGKAPVKPNKTVNIVLGGFFGLLLAGALGGVAFFISKSRQRNRAPEALAGS